MFSLVWADNADALAKQYAGTGALKTDFTRLEYNDLYRFYVHHVCPVSCCTILFARQSFVLHHLILYVHYLFITRTGKRSFNGMLKDGYNSAIRYFMNNFYDGFRQV